MVLILVAASCRSRDAYEPRHDLASEPRSDAAFSAAFSAARGAVDTLGTIYPRDAAPHPMATRLCDALHGISARRKAECCGGEPASFLATECARILGATLHAGTARLEEAAVERCASAMTEAASGCDWITPSASQVPEARQHLLHGELERGVVCRSSLECAGDMHCEGVSPTKTGVCAPPGGEGAGCGTHVDVLATYVLDRHLATTHPFCADHCSLAAHRCGPAPEVGAVCAADVNCASDQSCVGWRCSAAERGRRGESCAGRGCTEGLRCVDGACAPLAGSGQACRADADCAAGGCVRGPDGRGACGAECSPSLVVLENRGGGVAMRLPVRPRAAGDSR